jgi:hypothetical protein
MLPKITSDRAALKEFLKGETMKNLCRGINDLIYVRDQVIFYNLHTQVWNQVSDELLGPVEDQVWWKVFHQILFKLNDV